MKVKAEGPLSADGMTVAWMMPRAMEYSRTGAMTPSSNGQAGGPAKAPRTGTATSDAEAMSQEGLFSPDLVQMVQMAHIKAIAVSRDQYGRPSNQPHEAEAALTRSRKGAVL
jgi:hypothetical protein